MLKMFTQLKQDVPQLQLSYADYAQLIYKNKWQIAHSFYFFQAISFTFSWAKFLLAKINGPQTEPILFSNKYFMAISKKSLDTTNFPA